MADFCRDCRCTAPEGVRAHAILDALARDDLDAALRLGLLDAPPCPACAPACRQRLQDARTARLRALAARERQRARRARLQRIAAQRAAARGAAISAPAAASPASAAPGSTLPPAAAAALARALEKARARRP